MQRNPAELEKPLNVGDALSAMWDFATSRSRETWCAFTGKVARASAEQDWCHLFTYEKAALLPVLDEFARLRRAANQDFAEQVEARKGQTERRASLLESERAARQEGGR